MLSIRPRNSDRDFIQPRQQSVAFPARMVLTTFGPNVPTLSAPTLRPSDPETLGTLSDHAIPKSRLVRTDPKPIVADEPIPQEPRGMADPGFRMSATDISPGNVISSLALRQQLRLRPRGMNDRVVIAQTPPVLPLLY